MKYEGSSVYDNPDFFEKYIEKREKGNAPNDLLEKPYIDALIGIVKGKDVLDMGCGDGNYGKELLNKGATAYTGIDGSKNMIRLAAQNLEHYKVILENKNVEDFNFLADQFDLIVSRLVFHYIEHLEQVFKGIHKSLKKEGIVVLSIEHPIITSCYDAYNQKGKRGSWIVDNYFQNGERINNWIGKEVIKYHRTITDYFQLFKRSGFEVMEIVESKPDKANFSDLEEYKRRSRIPLFLFFKLKKKEVKA